VKSCRIGEVEAVEENEGQEHFFNDALGDRMQTWGTFLANPSQNIHSCRHEDDNYDYHQHEVAISQEVGVVADRLNSTGSV